MSELTLESVKQEHPAIAAALIAEGASAERARLNGIDANTLPGYEKLAKECKEDPTCSPADAAVKQVAASRDKSSVYLDQQRLNEGNLPKVPVAGAPDPAPKKTDAELAAEEAKLPLEDRCKAQWDRDAELRAEYGDRFTAYVAFEQANAAGQVKILRGKE